MSASNWDRELAKIDKHIEALANEPVPPQPAPATPGGSRPPVPPTTPPGAAPPVTVERRELTALGVYGRLALAVALGVSMLFWPYPASCGVGLFGYLAAVATVIAAGVWSAGWTWRYRAPAAHVLALLVVLWGLALGGMEVLPRIGYAVASAAHPTGWMCK